MKSLPIIIVLIVLAVILLKASAYTVNEAEQVIIIQFGDPKHTVTAPGLYFKTPFIQKVHRLEKRYLPWDGEPENMVTKDKKSIFIDVWARWRIVDPLRFYQACRNISGGQKILDDLLDSGVRDVVAAHNLIECVRDSNEPLRYETVELETDQDRAVERIEIGRSKLEERMLASVRATADLKATYGMEVTDVHIKRVNYVENVRNRVYERMQSERTRIAKLFKSEAEEEANRILGNTRKELDEILGDKEQKSAEIRGAADAEVTAIYAAAHGQDPEFFQFLRQLEAYGKALRGGTRLVLSTDNAFLKRLRQVEAMEPREP